MQFLSEAEMNAFEDECFRDWLNHIDGRMTYEWRRVHSIEWWRHQFAWGESVLDAIALSEERRQCR